MTDDTFTLFDLTITVDRVGELCTCAMSPGDHFSVSGCKLTVGTLSGFCLYAIQAAMPLIPAKQRQNHPADWMESDALVACPGPACGLVMRIDRTGRTTFRHDDVSELKWGDMTKETESGQG